MDDDDDDQIYCICRSVYDATRFMIGCDKCDEWFHGDCIKLSADEANNIESFFCHLCRKKDHSLKIIYKKDPGPKKEEKREKERHKHKHKDKDKDRHRDRDRERHGEKHKKSKHQRSDFESFLKKIKSDNTIQKHREREAHRKSSQHKEKKHSRRCGFCDGCRRLEDCGKCDPCKDMAKFGGPNLLKHKCKLRKCKTFGGSKEKAGPPPSPKDRSPSPKPREKERKEPREHKEPKESKESKEKERKEPKESKEKEHKESKKRKSSPPPKPKAEPPSPKMKAAPPSPKPKEMPVPKPPKPKAQTPPPPSSLSNSSSRTHTKIETPKLDMSIDDKSDGEVMSSEDEKDKSFDDTPEFPFRDSPKPPKREPELDKEEESDSDWATPVKKTKVRKPPKKVRKKGKGQKRTYTKRVKQKEVFTYEEYTPFQPYTPYLQYKQPYSQDLNDDGPRQCYGPGCTEPARQGSKYCSDDCGLKLATTRIFEILPARIQNWHSSPCQAEETDKVALEKTRQEQMKAKQKLEDLDKKQKQLGDFISKVKQYGIAEATDSQEEETDSEMTVFCITCGHEVGQKTALKHMEKCYQKWETFTAFGSTYPSRIEGNIFCDVYHATSGTYCKRLKVLCPEHSKEPKASPDEVCGCPLQTKQFKHTGEVCRIGKRKCNKHPCWERMRRAEIDLERLRQWMKLEELFERERSIRTAMSNRAGVLSLMLHQTIDHDAMKPILKSAN